MQSLNRETISLLLFCSLMSGCSSEPDIRSHLGSGDELPLGLIADDEIVFIEMRGDHFERGEPHNDFAIANVFIEIRPNRMIYSRRYSVTWDDRDEPAKGIKTLDRQQLTEGQYQTLRERLAVYHPPAQNDADLALTPKDCAIPIDSVSPAVISFGTNFFGSASRFVFPSSCDGPSGKLIKDDLNGILDSVPPLEGLDGYIID